MKSAKRTLIALLVVSFVASGLFMSACKRQDTSAPKSAETKKDGGDNRIFLASLDLIDLTGMTGGRNNGSPNRIKENLSRILPVQKTTLDSAIFYSAALELDSAIMLLSRLDRNSLSDSLAAIYYVLRANAERMHNGNYELAMSHIDSALAINPRNARALNTKSAILNDLGRFQEALTALDSALAIDSTISKTRWYRATVIAKLGRAEEALASVEKDLQEKPDGDRYFLVNLKGWLLCMVNRCDEAIAYHDSALALNPKHYFGYLDKAIAQYKLNRFDDMIKTLDQADTLVPHQVWVKYNRACCYAKLKNRDGTLAALADAIATDTTAKLNAREDPDFAAYRDDPEFRKLVGLE